MFKEYACNIYSSSEQESNMANSSRPLANLQSSLANTGHPTQAATKEQESNVMREPVSRRGKRGVDYEIEICSVFLFLFFSRLVNIIPLNEIEYYINLFYSVK